MEARIHVELPPTSDAPRLARRAAEERLRHVLAPSVLEDAKLLVSELVTNSVKHGKLRSDGWVRLGVEVEPASHVARVEVSDSGTGFDHSDSAPGLLASGGRGLNLVEQIALRWGISRDGATVVWFELPADSS